MKTLSPNHSVTLRYAEHERGCKPWTLRGYRSVVGAHLVPAFGALPVEDVATAMIEAWVARLDGSIRTRNKLLIVLHGVLSRARKVPFNAAAEVEGLRERRSGDIAVFSPEEIWALVRAAESEQDAAIYLTAAFTGLRQGELLALRWRDVDFSGSVVRVRGSYGLGEMTPHRSRERPGRCRLPRKSPRHWQACGNGGALSVTTIPCSQV